MKKYKSPVTILLMLERRTVLMSDVHVVPYSTHSSHSELVDFVTLLHSRQIVPIVSGGKYSDIPKELYDLCRTAAGDASMRKHPWQVVAAGISTSSSEGSGFERDNNRHSTLDEEMAKFVEKVQRKKLVAGEVNFRSEVFDRKSLESRSENMDENERVWYTCSGSKAFEGVNMQMSGSREPASHSQSASYASAQTSPQAMMHFSQHDDHRDSDELAFSQWDLSGVELQQFLQGSQEKPSWSGVEDRAVDTGDTEQQSYSDEGIILPSVYLLPSRLRQLRCAQRKRVSSATGDSQKPTKRSRRVKPSMVIEEDESEDGHHPGSVLVPAHSNTDDVTKRLSRKGSAIGIAGGVAATRYAACVNDICDSPHTAPSQVEGNCSKSSFNKITGGVAATRYACVNYICDSPYTAPRQVEGNCSKSTFNKITGGVAATRYACVNDICDSPHTAPHQVEGNCSKSTFNEITGGVAATRYACVNDICDSPYTAPHQVEGNCNKSISNKMEQLSQSFCADLNAFIEDVPVCLARNTNRNYSASVQRQEHNRWTMNYKVAVSDCDYSIGYAEAYVKTVSSSSVCKGDHLVGIPSYQPQSSLDGDSEVPTHETRNQINGSFRTVSVPLRRDNVAVGGHDVGITFIPTIFSTKRKLPVVSESVNGSQFSNADIIPETPERRDPHTCGKYSKIPDGRSVRQEHTAAKLCRATGKRPAVVEESDKPTTKLTSILKRSQPKQSIPCQILMQSPLKKKRERVTFKDLDTSDASTDSRAKEALPEVWAPTMSDSEDEDVNAVEVNLATDKHTNTHCRRKSLVKASSSGRCEERVYCAGTIPVNNVFNTSVECEMAFEDCIFTVQPNE